MKVTVYGAGHKKLNDHEIKQCKKLGKFLASIGAEILTSGSGGVPLYVGKEAMKGGAKVYGRSPARNAQDHVEKFGGTMDGVTEMLYTTKTYPTHAEGLLKRMHDMQPFSDLVIAMGGNWGTFYELILSLYYKKTIILVQEFDGASVAFQNVHTFFGVKDFNPRVHLGATLITVGTVDEAITAVKQYKQTQVLPK